MKIILLTLLSFTMICQGYGQTDAPINVTNFNPRVDSVAEQLVKMALMNPRVRAIENSAEQSRYEYKKTRLSLLNHIVVAGNLNELSIKGNNNADPLKQSTQYPRYNIGASISLGALLHSGKDSKIGFYKYEAVTDQVNIEKQTIRNEVLSNYENYVFNKELLALQREIVQDAKILLKKHEEKFGSGQMSLDLYTGSLKVYNTEYVKELNIVHSLRLIEIELENLIGMRIDDALNQISAGKRTN